MAEWCAREREWFEGLVRGGGRQWDSEGGFGGGVGGVQTGWGGGGGGYEGGREVKVEEGEGEVEEWPYGDHVRVSPLPSPRLGKGGEGVAERAVGAWWKDGEKVVRVRWDGVTERRECFHLG